MIGALVRLVAVLALVVFMVWVGLRFFPASRDYQYRYCQLHRWGPESVCGQFFTTTTVAP